MYANCYFVNIWKKIHILDGDKIKEIYRKITISKAVKRNFSEIDSNIKDEIVVKKGKTDE